MEEFEGVAHKRHLYALEVGCPISDEAMAALDKHMHIKVFPPADTSRVSVLAMDGHEKVMVEVCRTEGVPSKRSGRLMKVRKTATKGSRANKPYTCGWFMITEPDTGRVLALEEQKQPENNAVKIACLRKIMRLYRNVDALIHDRNCSFQPECERRALFQQVRYWARDKWQVQATGQSTPYPTIARREHFCQ